MVNTVKASEITDVVQCLDEPDEGILYEYTSQEGNCYAKLSRVGENKRLHIGVATPGSHAGNIVRNPIEHAENVGKRDVAYRVERLLDAIGERDDVDDLRPSAFNLDSVHDDYDGVRRTYFQAELREPIDV